MFAVVQGPIENRLAGQRPFYEHRFALDMRDPETFMREGFDVSGSWVMHLQEKTQRKDAEKRNSLFLMEESRVALDVFAPLRLCVGPFISKPLERH